MDENNFGNTTIAQDVLVSIARLTTLNVPGVKNTYPSPNRYERVVTKPENEGVRVVLKDNTVFVDINVVLSSELNVRIVSKEIQEKVSRAISEMVGLEVGSVNIHVCDILFEA